jgi:putative phage-type endonuclease
MRILTKTEGMSREEWLKWRQKGIGGSDIAIIAGVSNYKKIYKTPYELYLEKLSLAEDQEESEAAYWGNTLEPVILKEFTKRTEIEVYKPSAIFQHDTYDFMLANVDGFVVGKNEGIEIKTSSEYLNKEWQGDKIPPAYYLQCMHYLAVTGFEKWHIAALVGGNKFYSTTIKRNDDLIESIICMCCDFWECVVNKTPPTETR